ncbi:MAG: exosortase E/protease, VPEID-CTERM system [Planctomycetes bacterium]|nr:exosortase E/protease, VPEID-CTERM system [Planctomycetota bacterium]
MRDVEGVPGEGRGIKRLGLAHSARRRALLVLLAIVGEVLALSVRYRALERPPTANAWDVLAAEAGVAPQIVLSFLAALLLVARAPLEAVLDDPRAPSRRMNELLRAAAVHVAAFAVVVLGCERVLGAAEVRAETAGPWVVLTGLAVCAAAVSAFDFVLPVQVAWRDRARLAGPSLVAFGLGLAAWACGRWVADDLTRVLRGPTLWVASRVVGLVEPEARVDEAEFVLGTDTFEVCIAPQCSGFEGVGLLAVFLSAYVFLRRRELRLPAAWILPIAGAFLAWFANALRIAVLVLLGSRVSSDLAVEGFHSLAGLVLFIGLALGCVRLAQRFRWFERPVVRSGAGSAAELEGDDLGAGSGLAELGPYLVLLGAGLLTSGLQLDPRAGRLAGYAAAVIVSLLLLPRYRPLDRRCSARACGAGVLVAGSWFLLAGPRDRLPLFPGAAEGGLGAALAAAQAIGFVLVTPWAEELAFRVHLFRRLGGGSAPERAGLPVTAWLVSTLAFAALHESWFAAAVAGLVFGGLYVARGRAGEAFWAHAIANAALVLAAGLGVGG